MTPKNTFSIANHVVDLTQESEAARFQVAVGAWETPAMTQAKAAMESMKAQELAVRGYQDAMKIFDSGATTAFAKARLSSAEGISTIAAYESERALQAALALSTPLVDEMKRMAERLQQNEIAKYAEEVKELLGASSISASIQAYLTEINERERSAIDQLLAWGLQGPPPVDTTGYAYLSLPPVSLSATGVCGSSLTATLQGKALPDSARFTMQDMACLIVAAISKNKVPEQQRYLLLVFYPLLLMLLGALIAPISDVYVKKWLGESEQESVKQVKVNAVSAVGTPALLAEYRFVSAQALKVRSSPSAGSPPVGNLRFGQAVRVECRQKDFTLVAWQSEDGGVSIRGWVFTRYLKTFN